MVTKSLSVLGDSGAGKKTLIGCLIYKCGLELPQLEDLEREGIRKYAEIVPFYEKKGRVQSFHASSGPFVIEKLQAPDVAFWVIDATSSVNWSRSAQNLSDSLFRGTLRPREKLFILVNKMDSIGWSEDTFREAVRIFSTIEPKIDCTYIVPISGLQGDNVLESPEGHSWVKDSYSEGSGPVSKQSLMYLLS